MGRGLIAGMALTLLATACGGEAEPPPLTDPTTTPTTTVATTVPTTSSTTTTIATTTTASPLPTAPSGDHVGDLVAFERQIDEIYEHLGRFAAPRDEVPFPDVTNPDPVAAFQSLIEFHYWMVSTNPRIDWVKLYALDSTQYALDRRNQADRYSAPASLMMFDQTPFTFHAGVVVDITSIGAPPRALDDAGDEAVAIEYSSSVGDLSVENVDNGTIYETYDGWTELVSQAIVVPTGHGWRIAFVRWND